MPDRDALALQALLYAGGELSGDEAAAFERRLADDQAARDALVQAVQLALPLADAPPRPDPAYRAVVKQRLHGGWGRWLIGRRSYRGHPLLWTGLGAAAAVLAMLYLYRPASADLSVAQGPSASPSLDDSGPLGLTWPEDDDETFDVAQTWAGMPKNEHLIKARDDEMRRKERAQDRPRASRPDVGRDRPLTNSNSKSGGEKPR
jgi:hypothetical protein